MTPFLLQPKNIKRFLLSLPTLVMLLGAIPAQAQFYNGYQMEFGRSRVQFEQFLWNYYKFERFDTYFYLNGKELALHTARYADSELSRMESMLDTYLEGKIQFIIFNNLNDLKQSNLGLTAGEEYNIGGVSHILGNKVVLYFDGSMVNFEQQIRRGLAHVLLQNAIFGNNIGAQVMNSFLQNLPQWYTTGLVAYLAEEWNTRIDNRIRNIINSGRFKKFNRLTMDENYVTDAGHSFWRFIADRYGKNEVISVINMTRVSRSIETGFQYVIGLTLDTLFDEWKNYYTSIYENDAAERVLPPDDMKLTGKRILKRNQRNRKYTELQISPTGGYAAFVTNETGKYKVWLHNMRTEKLKKLYTGGYKLDEKKDYTYPILDWHPTGRILTMVLEEKGLIWLYFYNIDDREWTSQNIFGFQKILDISYSGDGRTLLMSAVKNGQSDLFSFRISSGSHQQITNDIYDDLNPGYINGTGRIIFSSNRTSDTLTFGEKLQPTGLNNYYDIFMYDPANPGILRRVTETPLANEIQPMSYGQGHITYLSDQNGIYNEYIGKLDSAVAYVDTTIHYRYFTRSFPITNYSRNITGHHVSFVSGLKTWVINQDLYEQVYFSAAPDPDNLVAESLTPTNYRKSLLAENRNGLQSKIQENRQKQPADQSEEKKERKSFRNVMRIPPREQATEMPEQSSKKIDLKNYQLDKQGQVGLNIPDSLNAMPERFKPPGDTLGYEFVIPKQRLYYTEYSINKLVTQLDFNYLNQTYQAFTYGLSPSNDGELQGTDIVPNYNNAGMRPTFKAGVTDLMEDYRIMGGLRIGLDLVNKEYFLNYANLKKRLDKEFIFQRRNLEQSVIYKNIPSKFRQKINEGFFVLTWPFNRVLRVRGTFLLRNEKYLVAGPDEIVISEPEINRNWFGGKVQLIYDDTKQLGLNLLEGTRFKVFGEYNQQFENPDLNLLVLGFDARNYQRIHRQFIWANRIAGSTNFGTRRLIYFMGGTDSWMFPKFDQETRIDPNYNWAYQTLATNMRGFNQNARNGNNFLLFNTEFRMPLFRYLLNKPIKSELVKNFQLVAFGDVGTAWTGWNPWDKDNVLYNRFVYNGSMRIQVQYEKDPIIAGIGLGARTKLLGYFLKADLAWPVEDGEIKKNPRFYLSMSLDF